MTPTQQIQEAAEKHQEGIAKEYGGEAGLIAYHKFIAGASFGIELEKQRAMKLVDWFREFVKNKNVHKMEYHHYTREEMIKRMEIALAEYEAGK
jgi:hypothetical protein